HQPRGCSLVTELAWAAAPLPICTAGEKLPRGCSPEANCAKSTRSSPSLTPRQGLHPWLRPRFPPFVHRYEVDDIDEEGKERHTLSRRRVIPLPQWKANPETDPEALFQKEQLVLALYPQTTCFYRALIHAPPQRVNQPPWERPW
uniref:SGF29 C-terminal domain-containing protein n=1 Tax=Piliocolobus tephrosceles TaxID=591936 RepID=A0A8C9H9G7_9PRIM